MEENMELLKKLTQTTAVSGSENAVISIIKNEIKDYVDEMYTDSLGNLIARKKGSGKKLLFSAHTDEIGLMANYIDDKGFVYFSPVGGVDVYASLYQRVVFSNGVFGTVCFENKTNVKKDLKESVMYIDIGANSKEEALSLISYGDTASFVGQYYETDNRVVSKALDNRAGVYILIESIKRISITPYDLYFLFSSQEEIGLRGAKVATYSIEPDIAVAVDVTDTGDTPGCEVSEVKCGKGVALKIMDKSVITHKGYRDFMANCAVDANIDYQYEILNFGGTDAGAMQTVKCGAITGAVSLPVRYIHTTCETADKSDIESCIKLVCEISKKDFIFA